MFQEMVRHFIVAYDECCECSELNTSYSYLLYSFHRVTDQSTNFVFLLLSWHMHQNPLDNVIIMFIRKHGTETTTNIKTKTTKISSLCKLQCDWKKNHEK